jgi:hypothetical protein
MEWQASYAAGALLMPISRLAALVTACLPADPPSPLPVDQPAGRNLQQRTSEAFMVSPDAAAVRLAQLGYVGPSSHELANSHSQFHTMLHGNYLRRLATRS